MHFCASIQDNLSLLQVRIESAMRFMIFCLLSTGYVRKVPRYVAACLRGTRDPSVNFIEDCFRFKMRLIYPDSVPYYNGITFVFLSMVG